MKRFLPILSSFLAVFWLFVLPNKAAADQANRELPIISSIKQHLALKAHQELFDGNSLTNSNSNDLNPGDMLISAFANYRQGHWAEAAALYSPLVSLLPEIEDYLLLMQAQSAMNAGDYAAAKQAAERLKSAYADSRFYKNNPALTGDIALAAGDYALAITAYSELISEAGTGGKRVLPTRPVPHKGNTSPSKNPREIADLFLFGLFLVIFS